MITTLPHGTTIAHVTDGWVRRDRDGGAQAELRWAGERLAALTVTGNSVQIPIRPYAIVTVRLQLQ